MDYSCLAQASGGILKEKKSSVYFLDYKAVCGRFWMKSPQDIPHPRLYIMEEGRAYLAHIRIPQPDGPDAYIEMHDVNTASKMLGFYFSPAGNSNRHIDHMVEKGLDWVESLQAKPVSCSNAWLSMYFQLFPAISWDWSLCVCNRQSWIRNFRRYTKRHYHSLAWTARLSKSGGHSRRCTKISPFPISLSLCWPRKYRFSLATGGFLVRHQVMHWQWLRRTLR
jgi:hypothetical protein